MSRFNLPELNLLERDPALIEKSLLDTIYLNANITLDNADPRRQWVKAVTDFIVLQRNQYEHALKQNLLSYAEDEALDHLGADTPRLKESFASTTIQFNLHPDRVSPLLIGEGTLFLVGSVYFETKEPLYIPVGVHSETVKAYCTEAGTIGNGYLPGEISTLVRPLEWVVSVENITVTSGGAEAEENDPYAERIQLSNERFSTAGPELAYVYWAKTASQNIIDILPDSPQPNHIVLYVLMQDGTLPTEEDLQNVEAICNQKTIRPMTDVVSASAPTVVHYNANATYYIEKSQATVIGQIEADVQAAYQEYLLWQRSKLGRDVDKSELIKLLKSAGAARVTIEGDMHTPIAKSEVAFANNTTLTFGGFSDA